MLHHTENQPNYSTNINKHLSTLPRLANCHANHLSKRRRRKKKLRKEFASKKYGATSHKQVASRYFRQPSAGNSSDAWNNDCTRERSRGSLFEEVPAIQSRQRVNVDGLYYRYGNGVSLFLRWGNVTVGSKRIPSLETRRN